MGAAPRRRSPRRHLLSRVTRLGDGALTLANGALGVPVGYLATLTTLALVTDRRRSARPVADPVTEPPITFAVLIPAHNEAASITTTVDSIRAADQSTGPVAIHVVADNCDDATAEIARAGGATVHERFDEIDRGKGPALNWLLGRLHDQGVPFDVAVFVDADTTVSAELFTALAARFHAGATVVQGHYGVREAFASAPAALRFCALACRHHLRPLGRAALGGSCGLFGNGMAFRRDVIESGRWQAHLVEDMALQVDLFLDGVRVDYAADARVEAEMPHTFANSVSQHQRWEVGRLQLMRRAIPRLVPRLARPRGTSRVAVADEILDLAVPPLSLLAAATVANAATAHVVALVAPSRRSRRNAVVSACLVIAIAGHVAAGLRLVRAPAAAYRALLHAPRLVAWKLMTLARATRPAANEEWVRTRRNAEGAPAEEIPA